MTSIAAMPQIDSTVGGKKPKKAAPPNPAKKKKAPMGKNLAAEMSAAMKMK